MDYFDLKKTVTLLNIVLKNSQCGICRQPEHRTLLLSIKSRQENLPDLTLVCDCGIRNSGLYISQDRITNDGDTLLARTFRKKISGSTILNVSMPYPDRIVVIELKLPEWSGNRAIWIEFCGAGSNLCLIEQETRVILECLTKFPESSPSRPLRMPGRLFESCWDYSKKLVKPANHLAASPDLWPKMEDENIMAATLLQKWAPMTPDLSKRLVKTFRWEGIQEAMTLLAEVLEEHRSDIDLNVALDELLLINRVREDFCSTRSLQQLKDSLRRIVSSTEKRFRKMQKGLESDLSEIPVPESVREKADLLAIHYHELRQGMREIVVPNVLRQENDLVRIELDPTKNPKANLNILFKKAGKAERAGPAIRKRISQITHELELLHQMQEEIDRSESMETLNILRSKLNDAGFVTERGVRPHSGPMLSRKPYLRFQTNEGWAVWVGRNAHENDMLTFRDSSLHDFWLHAKGYHGAHVVIKNPDKLNQPPQSVAQHAARLAAYYSKGRGEKAVSVIFTKRKNVRRAPGNHPGLVKVARHDTLNVST